MKIGKAAYELSKGTGIGHKFIVGKYKGGEASETFVLLADLLVRLDQNKP